jgi:hypothetical protein
MPESKGPLMPGMRHVHSSYRATVGLNKTDIALLAIPGPGWGWDVRRIAGRIGFELARMQALAINDVFAEIHDFVHEAQVSLERGGTGGGSKAPGHYPGETIG